MVFCFPGLLGFCIFETRKPRVFFVFLSLPCQVVEEKQNVPNVFWFFKIQDPKNKKVLFF